VEFGVERLFDSKVKLERLGLEGDWRHPNESRSRKQTARITNIKLIKCFI
jgi:hypothetical protein